MTEEVVFRIATAHDLEALIRCDLYAQSHAARRANLRVAVAASACTVAVINEVPVGYAVVEHHFFGHAFVGLLTVDAAHRRRGIGSKLLTSVYAHCSGDRLFTSTNASNIPALRLLAKAGFERSGSIDNLDDGDSELIFFMPIHRADGTLRQAQRTDIPAIHAVRMSVRENQLARSSAITERDYVEHLETVGRGWVIEAAGEVVGFVVGNAQSGNIWALFVRPDCERRGFGRRLLDTAVDWLWSQGLTRLWLSTEPTTRAQSFYESAGWVNAGTTGHGEIRFELSRPSAGQSSITPPTEHR